MCSENEKIEKSEWFDDCLCLIKPITSHQAHICAHQGDCDDDVRRMVEDLDFSVPTEPARKYLDGLGIDNVDKMSQNDLNMFVLWDISWRIIEEYGDDDESWNQVNIQY